MDKHVDSTDVKERKQKAKEDQSQMSKVQRGGAGLSLEVALLDLTHM